MCVLLLLLLVLHALGELHHLSGVREVLQRQAQLHHYSASKEGCRVAHRTYRAPDLFGNQSRFAIAMGLDREELQRQRASASEVFRQQLKPLFSRRFKRRPR
jgi:hypothetical protein